MKHSVALKRYLDRHIEADLPEAPPAPAVWKNAVVIPAYGESPGLLQRLRQLPTGSGKTLLILVLNRPDSDSSTGANSPLRNAIHELACSQPTAAQPAATVSINPGTDLFLYDLEQLHGPVPAARGVGLARKYGCDIALQWMHRGSISSDWICSTDADARLPADYFQRMEKIPEQAVAAVFPFSHQPGPDPQCNTATALYELRLHYYVLGLEYAGSPYAYHTLGSCLAVRPQAYTQVRGFPRRAGGEDFYLLNKLAKLGAIARPGGLCIELESRTSHRVPFGTGPAVARIVDSGNPQQLPVFYHPRCFHALRCLLNVLPPLAQRDTQELPELLRQECPEETLAQCILQTLSHMGMASALEHCRRQSKTPVQFLRHFHQWFDGFRTLKFIHAMREAGWADQTLAGTQALDPLLWPRGATTLTDVQALREAIRDHFGWLDPGRPHS